MVRPVEISRTELDFVEGIELEVRGEVDLECRIYDDGRVVVRIGALEELCVLV